MGIEISNVNEKYPFNISGLENSTQSETQNFDAEIVQISSSSEHDSFHEFELEDNSLENINEKLNNDIFSAKARSKEAVKQARKTIKNFLR